MNNLPTEGGTQVPSSSFLHRYLARASSRYVGGTTSGSPPPVCTIIPSALKNEHKTYSKTNSLWNNYIRIRTLILSPNKQVIPRHPLKIRNIIMKNKNEEDLTLTEWLMLIVIVSGLVVYAVSAFYALVLS